VILAFIVVLFEHLGVVSAAFETMPEAVEAVGEWIGPVKVSQRSLLRKCLCVTLSGLKV